MGIMFLPDQTVIDTHLQSMERELLYGSNQPRLPARYYAYVRKRDTEPPALVYHEPSSGNAYVLGLDYGETGEVWKQDEYEFLCYLKPFDL